MARSTRSKSTGVPPRSHPSAGATSRAETHQQVEPGADPHAFLTTNHGTRISDNQNSLRLGARGPTLLEDFVLREKIFHFDHERIPERIVHARGSGAHGYLRVHARRSPSSRAPPSSRRRASARRCSAASRRWPGRRARRTRRATCAASRSSSTRTRATGTWSATTSRCSSSRTRSRFPDLVHAVKPEADRGFPQAASAHDTFWDFVSLMPETTHMIMWAMSDRAIPRSFRMMEGFGVHTFRFVNARRDDLRQVPLAPRLGMQSTLWDEAVKISGADPDFHRRDLWEAITNGEPSAWDLGLQVFDEEFADAQPYDVLDATKIIPEEDVPLMIVGRLVLDRWPDNFFAETEQVAFLPSNVIPGIDFSDDPLLQGRLFSYLDTQKSRLGTTNFHQIPVNAPKCPFHNFQRDGMYADAGLQGPRHLRAQQPRRSGRGGRAAREPERRLRQRRDRSRSTHRRRQAPRARRALRRPLQPGAPVLPVAGADRAGAPRVRARVRAVEGRDRARPQARRREPAQRRRGPGRARGRGTRPAVAAGVGGRRRSHRHAAVAGAVDRREH